MSYKGLEIPQDSDTADGPGAFADFVDSGPVPRFANAAARNTAITTPVVGQLCVINVGATPILQVYETAGWVAVPNGLVANNVVYSSILSGEIGGTAIEVTWVTITVRAGHTYRIDGYITFIHQNPSGPGGGTSALWVEGHGIKNSRDVYLWAPDVTFSADVSAVWTTDATGPVRFSIYANKSWWSGPNVKYAAGSATPFGLVITDLGPSVRT
jgi:hypothetical protein